METTEDLIKKNIIKQRSAKYPSNVIDHCIEIALKVDREFTDVVFTPKESISKFLGLSGGSFDMLISSCCQYGLLELKKTEGYKPTSLLKKIKKPLPSENVSDFYKECFVSPPLYKKLISEFNGKPLPALSGLANILDRIYEIKGSASTTAARVFLKNASSLDMIAPDNILQIDGGITPIEEVFEESEITRKENVSVIDPHTINLVTHEPMRDTPRNYVANAGTREIPIFLKGGRDAKIILPDDFTDDDIRKVSKVLSAYLPD